MRTNLMTKNTSIALAALFVFVICLPRDAQAACTSKGAAELNRQGLELVKKKQNADAMLKFSAALDCYPNNPEYKKNYSMTWYVTASQVFEAGNYKTAIAFFKNALAADPSNKEARDALAIAERKLKEQGAAGEIQQSSPPTRPIPGIGEAQRWQPPRNASESERKAAKENEIGIREFDNGQYVYAVAAFERALMLDQKTLLYRRNRAKALHGLGKYYLSAGMYPAADTTLKSAHNDDPGNENIRVDIAIAESKLNEANAKEALRIAKEGDALQKRGDYSGYIAKYREALRYDPSNDSFRDKLVMDRMDAGSYLKSNGDLAGAIIAYREAVAFNSSYGVLNEAARTNFAICEAELARKMGDFTRAIQKYRDALEVRPSTPSNGRIRNALVEVQLRLATKERQELLKRGDAVGAEAKSKGIIALEATSSAVRQISYSTPQSNAQRLSEFNVLRYATLNPQTGNITLVGIYDPAYPSGPIPYYDLLADALRNPYPKFSLVYDPGNPALRQIEQKIDSEIDRVRRNKNYGAAWLKRLMMTALDPRFLSDDRLLLMERLSQWGIPPDAFATYLAWDQRSGLLDVAFREKIALVTAKLLAAVGVEERIGYAMIGLKELGFAIEEKAHGRPTGDKEQLGDKTQRIFQSLGIESEFYRIQEAMKTGRITRTQEWLEVLATIYRGVLRGLKVPESEVISLIDGFRAGRISEETVTGRLNPQFIALVGQSMSQNLFNGFRVSGVNLSKMYSLPPVMSRLQLFGSRPDSSIMRVFFNADYALKDLSHATIAANSVLRHESFEQHLSLAADRAGSASARLPARGVIRFWVFPGTVKTALFPDGDGIRFDSATVRIGAEPLETPTQSDSQGMGFLREVLSSYAERLTTQFDDYARAYPSLHVVRETEKVLALTRWIKSRKASVVAPESKPSRNPLPESVEAFWGLTYIVKPTGENDEIYLGVSGGVSFDKDEGEDWVQVVPNVEATDDVLHQLAASTAFAQQAADKALSGDLDAARDLAEKSAQAMTGQIDRTKLPQLPTPQFTATTAENTVAVRLDVARAAVTAADQNIRAIRQAKQDQNKAAPLRIPSPEQYQQAVEAAEKVRLRSERNLKHLNDLLAQYGLRPGDPATVATALGNLDPNAPAVDSFASPNSGTPRAPRQQAEESRRRARELSLEGNTLSERGDFNRAIAKYREALEFDPSNEAILDSLFEIQARLALREGQVLLKDGDLNGAIEKYKELIVLNKNTQSQEFISFRTKLAEAQAEMAAAVYRLTDLEGAVHRYRIAHTIDPFNEKISKELARAEEELAEQKAKASFQYSETGVVGGTGWTRETYFHIAPLDPEMRRNADIQLKKQLLLSGVDNPMSRFVAIKDYDYILGVAVSSSEVFDLSMRVLEDQLRNGRATPSMQSGYDLLRGRSFGTLDCHSNGAMVCLAALRNGDITAKKVRLLGPQLSQDALRDWVDLLKKDRVGNKIEDLEIVVNDHDPVPHLSYMATSLFEMGKAVARPIVGAIVKPTLSNIVVATLAGTGMDEQISKNEQINVAGLSVRVTRLPCASGAFDYDLDCHKFETYKLGLNPDWRKRVYPLGASHY